MNLSKDGGSRASSELPLPEDIEAARLLLGLTQAALAGKARLHPEVVRNATKCGPDRRASEAAVRKLRDVLRTHGVIFEAPGIVRHKDCRLAPTRKAVGKMTGRRIAKARNALGYSPLEIAAKARVSTETVRFLECQQEFPRTKSAFAVVGALQQLGYQFGRNHSDRALVARRRKNLRAWERDISIDSLPGLLRMWNGREFD